jgi:RNA polymerase sigma-B factor
MTTTYDPTVRTSPRDELISGYQPLAFSLARRYANRGETLEDLGQVALLGLVKAAQRFDPDRGVEFSTFATVTITGELRRHFRDKRWAVHVPRSAQERYLVVRDTRDLLTSQLGRSPTIDEVAQEAGLLPEEVLAAQETAQALRVTSIDAPAPHVDGEVFQLGRRDPALSEVETRLTAEALISRLGQADQELLRLRFIEGLTQAEVGARLGISQMQVSRLLSRALQQLRFWAAHS